jgi:hypothetical protein
LVKVFGKFNIIYFVSRSIAGIIDRATRSITNIIARATSIILNSFSQSRNKSYNLVFIEKLFIYCLETTYINIVACFILNYIDVANNDKKLLIAGIEDIVSLSIIYKAGSTISIGDIDKYNKSLLLALYSISSRNQDIYWQSLIKIDNLCLIYSNN